MTSHTRANGILLCVACFLAVLLANPSLAQTIFTEVTDEIGLRPFPGPNPRSARSVVFSDYNNDGFQDLFVTENRYSDRRISLFRNTGDGGLVDETFLIPEEYHIHDGWAGAIFGDYDNDGDDDLFLPAFPHNALLRNDRGRFTTVETESDLNDSLETDNAIWLDYDRDGSLDLYVASEHKSETYPARANRLLRNMGGGSFSDRTAEAGLDLLFDPERGGSWGGTTSADFDNDGWPDLYAGVTNNPNRLFLNNRTGGFEEVASGGIGDEGEAFSIAVGDIDNDGDLDLFQAAGGSADEGFKSLMHLNLGEGQFLDVAESVGLGVLGTNTVGSAMADVDNDGDLDLVIGRSTVRGAEFSNFLLLNDGVGFFVDATATSGIDEFGAYVAFGDYDEDGFIDLLYSSFTRSRTSLYRNNGNGNHWLRVELVGQASNRNGIGARVTATSGDLSQIREVLGGLGRQQDELVVHFGLGQRTQVDRLEIRWPSGQVDILSAIPADQKIRIFEGREGYHRIHSTRWEQQPPPALVAGASNRITATVRPALFEPDSEIGRVTADLTEMGGAATTDLIPDGNGIFRLDSVLDIMGANGLRRLSVAIEQRTSMGLFWSSLAQVVAVWPGQDWNIFSEASPTRWELDDLSSANLTIKPGGDSDPVWSPDGSKIAFFTDRDGNTEIYVMNADGTQPTRLTHHQSRDRTPAWSPDGKQIAFSTLRDGNWEIYLMNADGSDKRNLTRNRAVDFGPTWSPEGTNIAFSSNRDGNNEIYVMNVVGTDPIRLIDHPSSDSRPSWSPDGTRIAFQSDRDGNREIFVMNADGSNPINLTNNQANDFTSTSVWSPDSRQIAFQTDRDDGNHEIYIMDADGSNPVNLTDHPEADQNPAWSPDGRHIIFRSTQDGISTRGGNLEIHMMEVGGANLAAGDSNQGRVVFEGRSALELEANGIWTAKFVPETPQSAEGYETLRFAFHPGDIAPTDRDALHIYTGKNVSVIEGGVGRFGVDLQRREWQVVEIPLGLFEVDHPIEYVRFGGQLRGRFYLDDIRLITAASRLPTAVEEDASALPSTFALEQNYPNPFNSGTVIRFDLPSAGEMELAVFNLVGQNVATLVEGAREAGLHTVRWDGRNEGGHSLASGVYFYQLQSGDQVETRKLLLLR